MTLNELAALLRKAELATLNWTPTGNAKETWRPGCSANIRKLRSHLMKASGRLQLLSRSQVNVGPKTSGDALGELSGTLPGEVSGPEGGE
jgi:hypothetical protein